MTLQLLKLVMKATCTYNRMLMLFVRVKTVTVCLAFHPLTNRPETSRCAMKDIAFHTALRKKKDRQTSLAGYFLHVSQVENC